jgi:hypothetical protein
MKKFEGWRTAELQHVASLLAARELLPGGEVQELYNELIREIRNRRINEALHQRILKGIGMEEE